MDICVPADKNYPVDSVQCDNCGGHGCYICLYKGWHTPADHPKGRRCEYEKCGKPLPPDHVAIYCSNKCAHKDV